MAFAFSTPQAPAAASTDWSAYLYSSSHSSYNAADTAITPANTPQLVKKWHWRGDSPTMTGQPGPAVYATPAVVGGAVYVGANNGYFYKLSEATGAVLAKRFIAFRPKLTCAARGFISSATVAPDPADGFETVYVGAPNGYLYALRASDLTVKWRSVIDIPSSTVSDYFQWSSPTVANGKIYIGSASQCDKPLTRGAVVGFNQATGAEFARFFTVPSGYLGGGVWSSVAAASDGTVYASAPILLVVLRVFQGIAVGGEWSGSVLLSMEWGSQRRRGLMASWPQIGVPIGLILGTGAMTAIALAAPEGFKSWGWRIPFLFSLVLVAIGLWVRLRVLETPMFARLVERREVSKVPVAEVIRKHPKEILLSALLRLSEQAPFYIFTAFALTYMHEDLGMSQSFVLGAVTAAAALELVLIPTFGSLSDRLGRRLVYGTGAMLMGVVAFPYFAMINTKIAVLVVLGVLIAQAPHSIQYGPQAALISENFPTGLRYGGAGLGYQLASVVAGGPAPLIATWLLHDFGWQAIAVYIIFCAVVTLLATLMLPDRSRVVDIGQAAPYAATATRSS
jgi:MFS family permease